MTANGTTNDLDQANGKKSSVSAKSNKSAQKRLKKQQNREQHDRKRQAFTEATRKAYTTDAERKAKQHYAWTDNEAFNELVKRFGENFFEVIEKDNSPYSKWKTRDDITPPRNLLPLFENPESHIGLRFGTLTSILMFDLDTGSLYHPAVNEAEYKRLLLTLEGMGLARYQIVQSSYSNGLHIVIALNEFLPTWICAKTLHVTLTQAGFKIASGILEIFPNNKHYNPNQVTSYHGIRLPLQPNSGSVVLDPVTLDPIHADLNRFVAALAHDAAHQDLDTFKSVMRSAYEDFRIDYKGRVKLFTNRADAWRKDMLERIAPGFTASGQTNDLILEIGKVVYVFQKKEGQAAVEAMVEWVKSLPGYAVYCHHQHEIERRCWEWYRCITKLYYPYTGTLKERKSFSYGETIQATAATLNEDGRSNNKANSDRRQKARQQLAQVIKRIRQDARAGLISNALGTYRAIIALVIEEGKKLLGKGFGKDFLGQYKQALVRLIRFLQRTLKPVSPPEPPIPPAVVSDPPAEDTPPFILLKPVPQPATPAIFTHQAQQETAKNYVKTGDPGYAPIMKVGGEQQSAVASSVAVPVTPSIKVKTKPLPPHEQFPYRVGEKVKFQHESIEGWRKGTVVRINWQSGYFVNCVIKFSIFIKSSRHRPGQWVDKVVNLFNVTWIKPLVPEP